VSFECILSSLCTRHTEIYILKRWTKDAKDGFMLTNVFSTVSFTVMAFDMPGKEVWAGFTLQVAISEVAEMKQCIC
jgi:hypothetical protein